MIPNCSLQGARLWYVDRDDAGTWRVRSLYCPDGSRKASRDVATRVGSGMRHTTSVRAGQLLKALRPMAVTLAGIVMELSSAHPSKAA